MSQTEAAGRRGLIVGHLAFYGAVLAYASLAHVVALAPAIALGVILTWVSIADAETCEIPDGASALLAAVGVAWILAWAPDLWRERLLGALCWPALLWAVGAAYARWRDREGLGLGDVKLMGGVGLWVGVLGSAQVVLAAAAAATLTILIAALARRRPLAGIGGAGIPFAPFLCFSTWVIWLLGDGSWA